MDCFVHDRTPAVGLCSVCQKAVRCECVGHDDPRLVCRTCLEQRAIVGFEYRSQVAIGEWSLVHVYMGADPMGRAVSCVV